MNICGKFEETQMDDWKTRNNVFGHSYHQHEGKKFKKKEYFFWSFSSFPQHLGCSDGLAVHTNDINIHVNECANEAKTLRMCTEKGKTL